MSLRHSCTLVFGLILTLTLGCGSSDSGGNGPNPGSVEEALAMKLEAFLDRDIDADSMFYAENAVLNYFDFCGLESQTIVGRENIKEFYRADWENRPTSSDFVRYEAVIDETAKMYYTSYSNQAEGVESATVTFIYNDDFLIEVNNKVIWSSDC